MRSTASSPNWYPWYVVFALSIASMFSYIDRSLLNLLVAPVRADLHISDLQMSLLQGVAFGVFYALLGVPIARLADRGSRRTIIALGMLVWSFMTVCCGLAQSFAQLFIARVGVGVGEAALVPAAVSLLADYFPRAQLARANAALMLGSAVGAGIALLFGGALIGLVADAAFLRGIFPDGTADWQMVFALVGAPGMAVAALIYLSVREPPRGLREPGAPGAPAAALRAFVRNHRHCLATLFLAYPLLGAVAAGWLAWMPTLLIRQYGVAPQEAAYLFALVILSFGLAGTVLGGVVTDWLLARGHVDAAVRASMACAAGMAVAGGIAPHLSNRDAALALIGVFMFFSSFISILPPLSVQLLAPPALRAQLIAVLLLVVALVAALGPTVVAALTDLVFRDDAMIGMSMSLSCALLSLPTIAILYVGMAAVRRSMEPGLDGAAR